MANTVLTTIAADRYVAVMVTGIYSKSRHRLFLKEHREAKHVSAETMAGRLGIERESVYRLEREAMHRLSAGKQVAYAVALGLEPETLWRPPGGPPSLDAIIAHAPDHIKFMAADIVRRLVAGRG
jgi:transcriptional regulator with XRE-family HTH domain